VNNQIVEDLYNETSQTTIIVESPHTEEIKINYPLVGESGLVVSRAVLPKSSQAIGYEIINGNVNLSVMNTFRYARQLSSKMADINIAVNSLNFKALGPNNYKVSLKDIFSNSHLIEQELKESYLKRINRIIESSSSKPRLVICGFIAQAFFEFSLGFANLRFGKVISVNIKGRSVDILYVEHPSPKNHATFWFGCRQKNETLKRFVNCS
jgi:hypothetical protein